MTAGRENSTLATDPDSPVLVQPLMADLQARVRAQLRERLILRGGSPEFSDRELFDAVEVLFQRGLDTRDRGALLLPEMLSDEEEWRVDAPLRFSSHRRVFGSVVVFFKQHLLLPLTRWLYEYNRDHFERQHRLNLTLFACLESLAVENVRLRRDLDDLRRAGGGAPAAAPPAPPR